MSTSSTNPSTYFGGTWVAWGSGRVPVGVNSSDSNFNTVEKTGGAATHTHSQGNTGANNGNTSSSGGGNTGSHTLTIAEIPSHSHGEYYTNAAPSKGYGWYNIGGKEMGFKAIDTGGNGGHTHPLSNHTHTLNNHTHTNPNTNSSSSLQPYITCYMFKRTA